MKLDKELQGILDDCLDTSALKRKLTGLAVTHFKERFGDQADANRTSQATERMVKLFIEAREALIRDKVEKKLVSMIKELAAARDDKKPTVKKKAAKKVEDKKKK
jgi:hypothetical protein